jgi:Beta-galactosidase
MVSHVYPSNVVVFYDSKYPQLCAEATLHKLVPGSFELVDAVRLMDCLNEKCKLLISFHGSYFPKACWSSLLSFLEGGGNIAIFGGMPFARPVTNDGEPELEQDAYTRQIHLGPFFQVSLPPDTSALEFVPDDDATLLKDCPLTISANDPGKFWASYPKLTQADDHPEDMGSAGPFDTVLQPLLYAQATTDAGKHHVATPAFILDQRSGRFRGGRWLLSAWEPVSEEAWLANAEAIQRLLLLALEGVTAVDARPVLGCYQPGEAPSLIVTVRTSTALQLYVRVYQPGRDEPWQTSEVLFSALSVLQEHSLCLSPQYQAGLYRIEVEYQAVEGQPLTLRTGFWIWDKALVEATYRKRLTAGRDYFYQDDHLFLVCGTTYMDSRLQRRFLHLPNPARWDKDMAEMKAAGINLLRTGIWTAWRELVPVAGVANEIFLRALDAFVMTACKHNIQLIFTFFSFFPPLFEGENPWLDPRSVEAQQDFVALLARRYVRVELLFWDLINEPSFGDPKKIFALRPLPHYDHFEMLAFQRWLAERYTLTELQLRWRQTPVDIPDWKHVLPPEEEDFDTYVRSPKLRNSLKVADYTRFSQDAFKNWAATMVAAIRAGGGQTLVGVGQDEAGARISPQYYAAAVDYTTTHPWWNIDDLLWDMLIDKTPDKPNLIQETGIMLGRDIDGRPWRSEQANANLLERKLITGLMARSAGVVQWLWHTNSYMTSDNENSIGLLRADGSAKPELGVMEEFGHLVSALEGRVVETPSPEVWVVIPYAQWFASPDVARHGTQQAVRILGYELGIIPQMIGEHQLDVIMSERHHPRVIIVPVAQLLDRQAWHILLHYVHEGGTLLVNGVIGRDAHNLPFASGIDGIAEDLFAMPVSRYEELEDVQGQTFQVSFVDEKISYVKKAHNQVKRYQHGTGLFVWCGLPLELARETAVISMVYNEVIHQAVEPSHKENPTLISRQPLRDGMLILIASESSVAQSIKLDKGIQVTIEPDRAGALILETDATMQSFGGLHIDTEQTVTD